jgi:hypothetical protein
LNTAMVSEPTLTVTLIQQQVIPTLLLVSALRLADSDYRHLLIYQIRPGFASCLDLIKESILRDPFHRFALACGDLTRISRYPHLGKSYFNCICGKDIVRIWG